MVRYFMGDFTWKIDIDVIIDSTAILILKVRLIDIDCNISYVIGGSYHR